MYRSIPVNTDSLSSVFDRAEDVSFEVTFDISCETPEGTEQPPIIREKIVRITKNLFILHVSPFYSNL